MKNFIVLDLETPNRYCTSMSSIGIVVVKDGQIVDKIYSLINPEEPFDDFNIHFTGIGPEDVADAPTFTEFWPDIKDMLCDNVIVGQNITFDLSVISKTLTKYGMSLPVFDYYCTLSSCKRNLNLPDNSLTYIVKNVLNTTYNAHNAMDDALMTYELYNYLDDYDDCRQDHVKLYSYRPNSKRDFDRFLDYNFNYLYGLIKKCGYNAKLSDNYLNLLERWYEANKYYNYHPLLKNVLLKVSYIIEGSYDSNTLKKFPESLRAIKRSPKYPVSILKLQVLQGILDSVTCENTLKTEDITCLKNWTKSIKIGDKTYKKFLKNLEKEKDEKLKEYLEEYSRFLEDYIKDNSN